MRLNVSLKTAEKNETLREEIPSEWNDFRGNEDNNAVTEQRTPVSAADAVLYWANQAGISYGADAVSSPILVDGYLICTAKQYIFKINTTTGEVEQTGTMVKKSAFNITPPTYAKGMLFVALADGVIRRSMRRRWNRSGSTRMRSAVSRMRRSPIETAISILASGAGRPRRRIGSVSP